jgi:hypothetical protein
MQQEFSVAECLRSRVEEFLFSELHICFITHGSDHLIDTLKSSLMAKFLEASTDINFSVSIVLMMIRD